MDELRVLAESGDARGQLEYGVWLLNEKADPKAIEYFKQCISQLEKYKNNGENEKKLYGSACYALGFAYDTGRGIDRDGCESMRWLRAAIEVENKQAKDFVKKRRQEMWRRRKFDVILLICIIIFIAVSKTLFELCYVLWHHEEFKKEISGADETVPSYEWREGILGNKNTRSELIERAHELIALTSIKDLSTKTKTQPLSDSFQHTRGVIAHFTRPALNDPYAFNSPELNWIKSNFLNKVLDDRCNAFVFNILIIPPGRFPNRTRGVDFHVDQTLIQSTTQREQSAFTVSVAYIRIPPNMNGGELHLDNRLHRPREGSVLVFRGDQNHAVNAFCTTPQIENQASRPSVQSCPLDLQSNHTRISFVFEQYRLPSYKLRRSPYFILAPTNYEESFFPIISAFPLGPTLIDSWLHIRKRFFFPYKRRQQERHALGDEDSATLTFAPVPVPPPSIEKDPAPPLIRPPPSHSNTYYSEF